MGAERGRFVASPLSPYVLVTTHPSAVLRHPEKQQQREEYARLVLELQLVHRKLQQLEDNSPGS